MTEVVIGAAQVPTGNLDAPLLTDRQKLLVGGLGGMTPIVATLLGGEYKNFPDSELNPDTAWLYYIGFGSRVVLFFLVGAVFVWLHNEVRTRYAVFRLGLTAPALIAALVGASPANAAGNRGAWDPSAAQVEVALLDPVDKITVMSDAMPSPVVFQNCTVLDGFKGKKCR